MRFRILGAATAGAILLCASFASAEEPAPPAPRAPAADTLGGPGESCRARADCALGLACMANTCRSPNEGNTCQASADCGPGLVCRAAVCVVPGASTAPVSVAPQPAASTPMSFAITDKPAADRVADPEPLPPANLRLRPIAQIDLDSALYIRSDTKASGYTTTTNTAVFSSQILTGQYHLRKVDLEARIPWATASAGEGMSGIGNLALGAYYSTTIRDKRFRVGGAMGLPTGTTSEGSLATVYGGLSRGLENVWLWDAERFSLLGHIALRTDTKEGVQYGFDAYLGPMASTGTRGKPAGVVQVSADLGYRAGAFVGGARLNNVFYFADGVQDNSFLSLMPYAGADFERFFVNAGFLMNLDKPLGFSFDDKGVWGARLALGARL